MIIGLRKIVEEHFNNALNNKPDITLTLAELIDFADVMYKTGRIEYVQNLLRKLECEKYEDIIRKNPNRRPARY